MLRSGGVYRRKPARLYWETRRVRPTLLQGTGVVALTLSLAATGAVGSAPVTGTGTVALALSAGGAGSVELRGTGAVPLALGASGSGAVTVQGGGTVPLLLAASGAGTATVVEVLGAGLVPLVVQLAASGAVTVRGDAWLALPLGVAGTAITTPLPPATSGWHLAYRAGPRWRLAWRPLVPTPFPLPVSPGNDYGVLVDQVRGISLPDGATIDYPGGSLTAHWTTTPTSDVALAGVTATVARNALPPAFAVGFEASEIDAVLAGLADGTAIWLVLRSPGDFRAVIEHVVRVARVLT